MAESKFPPLLEEIQATYRKDLAHAQARFDSAKSDNETQYGHDWEQLSTRWRDGVKQVLAELSELSHDSASRFPAWGDNAWDSWKPASAAPGASASAISRLTFGLFPAASLQSQPSTKESRPNSTCRHFSISPAPDRF